MWSNSLICNHLLNSRGQQTVNKILLEHSHAHSSHNVYVCFHATMAKFNNFDKKTHGLQNVKYLLPDPLQKRFANSCTGDPRFNVLAHAARGSSNNLLGWLPKTWPQQWPVFNKAEIPEFPSHDKEEFKGLKRQKSWTEFTMWDLHTNLPHMFHEWAQQTFQLLRHWEIYWWATCKLIKSVWSHPFVRQVWLWGMPPLRWFSWFQLGWWDPGVAKA